MKTIIIQIIIALMIFSSGAMAQKPQYIISSPSGSEYSKIDKNGITVLPNGRFITPAGKTFTVAPHPFGLALSIDGSIAVTANSGTSPLAITIIRNPLSDNPDIRQVPPGPETDKGVLASVFMGLAISPDNKTVYVAGGQENKIFIFNTLTGQKEGFIDCSFKEKNLDYSHGYIGDMTINHEGSMLYAVDQINFRMLVIDLNQKKLLYNVPVGMYPFGITLSRDEKQVYVANVGMYAYSKIKRKKNGVWKNGLIDFPAFPYLSKESEEGIENDSLKIPGLGKVNSDESFSVWTINLANPKQPKVTAKTKTGTLVGQMVEDFPAVGGSSPNSLVCNDQFLFISNGNNDNITVLDIRKNKIVKNIRLSPDNRIQKYRGIIPFGLAISPDGKRLYVAESGLNAVGVINTSTLEAIGHIPTGWFPAKLKVSPDGKQLIVANAKGYGSGPNGGVNFKMGPEGSYIGSLMKGSVSVIPIPSDDQLKAYTQKVIDNNFRFHKPDSALFNWRKNNPVPLYPLASTSPIKHIIFISKENRTYDEIMGQVSKGDGDSTLARYGRNVSFTNRAKSQQVNNTTIMPNHLVLAERFTISDNFYVDADVSADGHRWLVNTYPNEWVEATTPANYGGNRDYKENSNAAGNLGLNGSAGAIYPEDYNEAGSMWDHFARHKISYFNFGFGVMFEPADYKKEYKQFGIKLIANYPLPGTLFDNTSRIYPTYNMAIPDQFRIDIFIKEYNEKWKSGKEQLPQVLTVIIPNDHGAGETASTGYPFRESYMADNDLAVGRFVEFISHTPYWKSTAIVITEDDAQNGVDHIDAHRSLLMLISPYAKRNYVSHIHQSFGSIFKTFWNILGLPYLNQYDAGANDMADMFTDQPDFTPYNALPVDIRIFDPQKALDPLNEKFNWESLKTSPKIDNPEDMIRESKEQDKNRLENREKGNSNAKSTK
jgi:YVTN family beta-propeller protein